jgi:DNA repair exonuclease SbcCD ATPase subunit
MIPQNVRLRGFLSYKDEQEIHFDDADLWMLSGLNGSGKSTVFDAVTYALFGHHRGGSRDAEELINKDSDRAAVEFEFALGSERFVAHRTIQRTKQGAVKGSQQLYRVRSQGQREPLEDTHLKKHFDEWVAGNIGLSYEVFTSSVLLLQGRAEKLLDSTAKGRFEVLADILDLERYERLHKRAYDELSGARQSHEALKRRLDEMEIVTPLELAAAKGAIIEADEGLQQVRQEVERLHELQRLAEKWQDVQARLSLARQRWGQAQKLLDDATLIEQDVHRLAELREVLPRLQTVIEQRGQILKSTAATQELEKRRSKLHEDLTITSNSLDQARRKWESLRGLIVADEQRQRETSAALRASGAQLEKLRQYERQENELQLIQSRLSHMPADPADALQKARTYSDELAGLAAIVPHLSRLYGQREQLRSASDKEQKAVRLRDATHAQGIQLRREVDASRPLVEAASQASQEADAHATTAKTLLAHARQQLADLTQLDGAKVCRACGQKLTTGHLQLEHERRQREVAQAETNAQQAYVAQQAAAQKAKETARTLEELNQKLGAAREEYKEHRAAAELIGHEVERLRNECGQIWCELPETYRARVADTSPADWLTTAYPTAADLAALRQQAGEAAAARRRRDDAEKIHIEWNRFKAQEAAAKQTLEALEKEFPADRQNLRGEHARLDVEDKALDAGLKAKRGELESAQQEIEHLTRERNQIDKQLIELKGKLETEEATRHLCSQTLGRTRQEMPDAWHSIADRAGTSELFRWQNERDALVEKQTDERGRQLQQARVGEIVLRQDLQTLEEEAAKYSDLARQEPESIVALLRLAQQTSDQRTDALNDARQRHSDLQKLCEQRRQLSADLLIAEEEVKYAKMLEELLSRKRLQLHLVRRAERQVVDHANAVLDRLSGGQLYLRLVGSADGEGLGEKALELEAHNRATAERPINVAFLSGSQRFRVAVSLALGLGQYASKQHRPIESVIIDEGFGCLDKEGRQSMIQELHNLRGQLKCILLVSHQEEFADAFADGYRFELADGTTRVTRFQR